MRTTICLHYYGQEIIDSAIVTLGYFSNHQHDSERSNFLVGIRLSDPIDLSGVAPEQFEQINDDSVELVTRHFHPAYMNFACDGGLYIGTLSGFRSTEQGGAGRLSDTREGLMSRKFTSLDSVYNVWSGQSHISDVFMTNFPPGTAPLEFQHQINDYCLCSSIGPYRRDRAERLRSCGNPDLGAYVVYDLKKLRNAIQTTCQARSRERQIVVGQRVVYDEKDIHEKISGNRYHLFEGSSIATWVRTAFRKPERFRHEEEYRLLWFSHLKAGQLPEDTSPASINHQSFADAIVEKGFF